MCWGATKAPFLCLGQFFSSAHPGYERRDDPGANSTQKEEYADKNENVAMLRSVDPVL